MRTSATAALLAATATLFSSALAFSPDQCNATSYGRPSIAACNTLLTTISKLGVGNTSYLFIPEKFPTPDGLPNNTRKNFPQSWETTGCKAALVPIEVTTSSVTYDTSSYQDLASVGKIIAQQCISNSTAGGWELAGDTQDLVLHLYAAGSEIDQTILAQTTTTIAATSENEIDDAEMNDPIYNGSDYAGNDSSAAISGEIDFGPGPTAVPQDQGGPATTAPVAAQVLKVWGTFNYLGCQLDSSSARTLSSLSWAGSGLTVQRCADYCAQYQYMGLEFGSECYCGGDANGKGVKSATIVTSGQDKCITPCNGDATQLCGGEGWLTVYRNSNSATAGATA